MDIGKLEFFFAAANSVNFTQAAEKCNIAQTTMSKYIAQLEDDLGVKLFYRTTRECYLTEAGHLFYNGAKDLRRDYEVLRRQLQNVTGDELGIGVYGEFFDLSILEQFARDHPEIDLKVSFDTKEVLYDQLFRRKIHAILIPDILITGIPNKKSLRRIRILSGSPRLFCSLNAIERYGSIQNVISELPYITKAQEPSYHDYCRRVLESRLGASFRDVTVVESIAKQQLLINLSQGFAIMLTKEAPPDRSGLFEYSLEGAFNETLELHFSARHVTGSLNTFINYINRNKLFD